MPTTKAHNRSLLIFYLLVGYVILQFCWWAFQIISLAQKVSQEEDFIQRKILMISGEALVFFIILGIGAYFVRKSFKKEIELSLAKRNFMLSVTHELKTPIASSKLFTETLLSREIEQQKREDILSKILKDQTRLQKLVENILLASQVEGSSLSLNLERVNTYSFIQSIVDGLESENQVVFDIPNDIEFKIDRFYFTSVIQNLHENAVKYSNGVGPITWSVIKRGAVLTIRIKDEGAGIPEEKQQKVFELFHRIGDENTRETKGTGIGLYIVKQIVMLHKGAIQVKSNSPKGSIFEIELPQ